jgi:predicted dehydrogenase
MRIGILGAGHWHVGLYYLPTLQSLDVDLVGLADPNPAVLDRLDPEGLYRHYTDSRTLLEEEQPDLVFAHAPHYQMTDLAAELVERGLAFHMEKPAGVDWRALAPVAEAARAQRVFNSVALVNHYMPLVEKLVELRHDGKLGLPVHFYYRLFAGPPDRYRDWGVDWMLDPAQAGAGPLFNFGCHGIDLFHTMTGEQVAEVSCWATHALHQEAIEDLASARLHIASGALGTVEVGYVLPGAYERYFSLTTTALHVGGELEQGKIVMREGEPIPYGGLTADDSYVVYTRDVVARCAAGQPARVDLTEMVRTLRVMDAAREAMETGQTVRLE